MLHLDQISFAYDNEKVIDNISFSVAQGQNVALIGESGCGKSTLLKLIYGLYDLDSDFISYFGKPVLGPKFNLVPGMDEMKYLAQDFDLMPFITVAENIGKYLSNVNKVKKMQRINELLELVEMHEFAQVKAQYLSGGQQQRVALARVLALEPQMLLLDEPFSQVDAFRRNNLRRNLFKYLKEKHITCIVATHDATDVFAFADEVLVLKTGKLIRKDSPKLIYQDPHDFYTASLFGDVNEIPMHLLTNHKDKNKTMFVYPHQIYMAASSEFKVVVDHSYFNGNGYLVQARYGTNQIIYFENATFLASGITVSLALKKDINTTD